MPSLTKYDQEIVQDFKILKYLVLDFTSAVTDAYLQKSVEFPALNIAASSSVSQAVQQRYVNPTSSENSTTYPLINTQKPSSPSLHPSSPSHIVHPFPPPPPPINPPLIIFNPPPSIMATWYAPLVLPQNLGVMPQDYQSKIPQFNNTQHITTQQHVDIMNDFFDRYEIDVDEVIHSDPWRRS